MAVGPYHRLESPTQTPGDAAMQVRTQRVCGRTARGGFVASVKAYVGSLPASARGIEFGTEVAPMAGTVPYLAIWREGMPGVDVSGIDLVCIPVTLIRNAKVP